MSLRILEHPSDGIELLLADEARLEEFGRKLDAYFMHLGITGIVAVEPGMLEVRPRDERQIERADFADGVAHDARSTRSIAYQIELILLMDVDRIAELTLVAVEDHETVLGRYRRYLGQYVGVGHGKKG